MNKIINKVNRITYSEECHICKKEIKGFSESQVKYNLEVHIRQKHK
jgi:hypothetical protein